MTTERASSNKSNRQDRITLSGGRLFKGDNIVRDLLGEHTEKINSVNESFEEYKKYARKITRARLRFDAEKKTNQPLDSQLAISLRGLYITTALELEKQINVFSSVSDDLRQSSRHEKSYFNKIHIPRSKLIGNISECCFGAMFYRGITGEDSDDYTYIHASPSADCGRYDLDGTNHAHDASVIRRETSVHSGDLSHLEAKTTSQGKATHIYNPETFVVALDEVTPDKSPFRYLKLPEAIVHDALSVTTSDEEEYLSTTIRTTKTKLEAHIAARIFEAQKSLPVIS